MNKLCEHTRRPPARIVVAYHGIFQRLTHPSWTAAFQAFLLQTAAETRPLFDSDHYFSGPIGVLNWFRNRAHGIALARRMAFIRDEFGDDLRVDMVGHSNGTNILVEAARRMAREHDLRVSRMVLIGSALQADVDRSGLAALVEAGRLDRATAYISDRDAIIGMPGWLKWPYGDLGSTGWIKDRQPIFYDTPLAEHFRVRVFGGFAHNDYFRWPHRLRVFESIAEDLEIPLRYTHPK